MSNINNNNETKATPPITILRYVVATVSFIFAAVIIVLTSINIQTNKPKTPGSIFVVCCKFLFVFLLIMVGVSELVLSDGVLFRYLVFDFQHRLDDSAYRIIKQNQSDVTLTPAEHYLNITGQVSFFMILLMGAIAWTKFQDF